MAVYAIFNRSGDLVIPALGKRQLSDIPMGELELFIEPRIYEAQKALQKVQAEANAKPWLECSSVEQACRIYDNIRDQAFELQEQIKHLKSILNERRYIYRRYGR